MTKYEELKEMIKEIRESIKAAEQRVSDAEKAQIEAESEIEDLSFNLETLSLAVSAIDEEVKSVKTAAKEKTKEALGTLLAKASGSLTQADIDEAFSYVFGETEEAPPESEDAIEEAAA